MDSIERGQDEDQQPFLPRTHMHEVDLFSEKESRKETSSWDLKDYLRLILEVGMAAAIIALLVRDGGFPDTTTVKSPVPKCNSHLLKLYPEV